MPTASSPAIFYRSDIIKYSTELELFFKQKYSIIRSWTIYGLDENDTIIQPEIKLSNNPTVNYNELVIRSNTLVYKKYKLIHHIKIKIDTGYLENVENEIEYNAEAYIKIVPGGVAVFSFENGLDYLKIGTNQSITLNPLKYAYDVDLLVSSNGFDFKFYCFVINKNLTIQNKSELSNFQNLLDFKTNYSLTSECFKTRDKIVFSSSNKVLTIKPKGLKYSSSDNYLFLVETQHYEKEYYQLITIEVDNFIKIPVISSR